MWADQVDDESGDEDDEIHDAFNKWVDEQQQQQQAQQTNAEPAPAQQQQQQQPQQQAAQIQPSAAEDFIALAAKMPNLSNTIHITDNAAAPAPVPQNVTQTFRLPESDTVTEKAYEPDFDDRGAEDDIRQRKALYEAAKNNGASQLVLDEQLNAIRKAKKKLKDRQADIKVLIRKNQSIASSYLSHYTAVETKIIHLDDLKIQLRTQLEACEKDHETAVTNAKNMYDHAIRNADQNLANQQREIANQSDEIEVQLQVERARKTKFHEAYLTTSAAIQADIKRDALPSRTSCQTTATPGPQRDYKQAVCRRRYFFPTGPPTPHGSPDGPQKCTSRPNSCSNSWPC